MNFYYDITLDFLERNYNFYEVLETDKFMNIKKIPLFQVNNKIIKDFVLNKVKVDNSFLNMIYNKTITQEGIIEYATILADKNNAIAFQFDKEGFCINYSPLRIIDEINLLEVVYSIKNISINYEIIKTYPLNNNLRREEIIKKGIKEEIDKLYNEKNFRKLQFLYLEWFNVLEKDINKIYKNMNAKLKEKINNNEEKIYKIIKISSNKV